MFFKDIPGQEKTKTRLIRSVQENRLSHALLLHGPEGCGKLAIAIAFARYISCTRRGESDACGQCASCIKYNSLVHPDLHFSFPSSANKKDNQVEDLLDTWRGTILENPYINQHNWYEKIGLENKQGVISKDQSENILRKMGFKAYESDFKIMIMWLPERMNQHSANRLLKLIEEPPSQSVFLLVSETPENILPTVQSRTQAVPVPKFSDHDIRKALQSMTAANSEVIEDAISLANGNLNIALASVREDELNKSNFDRFVSFMRMSFKKDVPGIINWVNDISAQSREKQKLYLLNSLRLIRENFMINLGKDEVTHMATYEKEFSVRFSKFVKQENVHYIYRELNEAYNHISGNGYSKIVFMDTALKMIRYLHM